MSEFSESLHLRCDDAAATKRRLRDERQAGILFGPSHGWLTFIPYEEGVEFRRAGSCASLAHRLSRRLGVPVLHYFYAADHGWGFTLVQPGMPAKRFAAWWHPAPVLEQPAFDPADLVPFGDRALLAPLLHEMDRGATARESPAYRFAGLLGLPAHEWLSPAIAQHDTEALLAKGGVKLGTKPAAIEERLPLPPNRHLTLAKADLSAREAVEIVRPFIAALAGDWGLARIGGYVQLTAEGRLVGAGAWRIAFARLDKPRSEAVNVSLYGSGLLAFTAMRQVESVPLLPTTWIDSTAAASAIAAQPVPPGMTGDYLAYMSLEVLKDGQSVWMMAHGVQEGEALTAPDDRHFCVDAVSGEFIGRF